MHTRQRDDDVTDEVFDVLTAYTRGHISRGQAMRSLELDWYGDLIVLVRSAGLEVQQPSPEDLSGMAASIAAVFGNTWHETDESTK